MHLSLKLIIVTARLINRTVELCRFERIADPSSELCNREDAKSVLCLLRKKNNFSLE